MKLAHGVPAGSLVWMLMASPVASAIDPCCSVTAVDPRTGVVSAQVKATKRAFEFKVDNAIQLQRVRAGQDVDADFQSGKVSIEGVPGRYSIVVASPAAAAPPRVAPSIGAAAPAAPPAPTSLAQPPRPAAAPPVAPTPPAAAPAPQPSLAQPPRPAAAPPVALAPPAAAPASPPSIAQQQRAAPASPGPVASSPPPLTQAQRPAAAPPAPAPIGQPQRPASAPTLAASAPPTSIPRADLAPATPAAAPLSGRTPTPLSNAPGASAAGQAAAQPADPCCAVTGVDTRSGIVAAQETRTQKRFEFKVDNAILLNRIRVGQGVEADFSSAKASVQGLSGRFSIVSGAAPGAAPATASARPELATPGPLAKAGGGLGDTKGMARTARKTYPLPTITAGAAESRSGKGRGIAHSAVSGVSHLRGLDEIESAGLPESAKIVLMMHAGTLPENASNHYIVNTQMAHEWAKTHKVPASMKPEKKKKKKKKCDWTHSGGCADKVQATAQDLWDSASEDWKRAWRSNTKNLAESWDELEECFVDHTLRLADIPVKFDLAPQFPISLDKSSSGGSSSGSAKGTLTVGLPVAADFRAQVEMFYIPCLPFAIRPKTVGADGSMTISARLGATITATGAFHADYTIPPGGGPAIPVVVIPIVIGGIPVATLDVSLYVDGTVRVGGEGQLDGRFLLVAPYRNDFDFECSGHGCKGRMRNVPVPTTTTENVVLKGAVHVQPAIYTALQLSLNFDALAGRAGPQPFLYGEVRGCSATAAMQNTSGQSTAQEFHALSADLDWGIEFRAEALVAGEQVDSYVKEVMARKHIWFADIAPGGSTAMSPGITGPVQLAVARAGAFEFKSRPCHPYPDAVEYRVSWVGGATQTADAPGSRPVAMRQTAKSTSSDCSWGTGQGTCTLKPGADASINLAWPQPGAYSVTVTPVRDKHGREFKQDRATQLNVNVQ